LEEKGMKVLKVVHFKEFNFLIYSQKNAVGKLEAF